MSIRYPNLLKNKYVIAGIIVVVLLILYIIMRGGSSANIEAASVVSGNVVEQVSVTGKISPMDKADLSFDTAGSIAHIYVKVGTQVKKGDILASLDNAADVASLASAQAKLDDITRSLRPEELQVEQAKVDSALVALYNASKDGVNAARSGFVQAQNALFNYADTFFANPQTANPLIKISTQSSIDQTSIDFERVSITDSLNIWRTSLDSTSSASTLLDSADKNLSSIKSFMDDLSTQINHLSPANSGLSQSTIDVFLTTINNGLSTLNQAIDSVTGARSALQQAQTAYNEAYSNFTLKNAGSSAQAIQAQQATVDSLAALVAKGSIYSPIDGIVTRVDPQEGEYATPGISGFAVQSNGLYKIEAYVPEADIAKVAIGDHADVTLDAYGSDIVFSAKVTLIDPAETVLEGVPTYKVTLLFDVADARIRSGMTANTEILTHEHDGVLFVPTRSILVGDNGSKIVRLLDKNGKTFSTTTVMLGLKGSSGTTEITSGLKLGDKVVTYVK